MVIIIIFMAGLEFDLIIFSFLLMNWLITKADAVVVAWQSTSTEQRRVLAGVLAATTIVFLAVVFENFGKQNAQV